jgi:protein-S-isoprenylcysteine O-methyltransferase Ste14
MSAWYGAGAYFLAFVTSVAIRAPHDRRCKAIPVAIDHMGRVEAILLALMGVAVVLLPLSYATGLLRFADHGLPVWAFGAGVAFSVLWLWLFWRAHAALGTNWSVSLQVREGHRLVTSGVYSWVRHPMYAALFAQAIAQALLLANWIAGPAMLIAFSLMFVLRVGSEAHVVRAVRAGLDGLREANQAAGAGDLVAASCGGRLPRTRSSALAFESVPTRAELEPDRLRGRSGLASIR